MKRAIKWEHWQDPTEAIIEEHKMMSKLHEGHWTDGENTGNLMRSFPIAVSQMGAFPLNDLNRAGNVMKFWIGHTNFDITEGVAMIIEKVNGVESVDIQTRYRFRIGVGKAFSDRKVMGAISLATCVLPKLMNFGLSNDQIKELFKLRDRLQLTFKYWSIIVTPNGGVDSFGEHDEASFQKRFELYKTTSKGVGALLFKSKPDVKHERALPKD